MFFLAEGVNPDSVTINFEASVPHWTIFPGQETTTWLYRFFLYRKSNVKDKGFYIIQLSDGMNFWQEQCGSDGLREAFRTKTPALELDDLDVNELFTLFGSIASAPWLTCSFITVCPVSLTLTWSVCKKIGLAKINWSFSLAQTSPKTGQILLKETMLDPICSYWKCPFTEVLKKSDDNWKSIFRRGYEMESDDRNIPSEIDNESNAKLIIKRLEQEKEDLRKAELIKLKESRTTDHTSDNHSKKKLKRLV